jgi:hypothetical protein
MFKLSLGLKYSSNLDTTSEHLYNLTNSSLRFQRNPTDQNFNSLKEMNFDSVDYLQNWNWKKYLDALNEYNRSSNIENFYLEITNLINDGFLDQFLMKRLINILQSNDKGERYEAEVKELEEKYLEKYPSGCLPSRLLVSNSKFDNYVYECTKCIENGGQVDSIIATAYLVNHYVNNEILEDARILIDRYKKSQGGYHFNDLFYRREYGLFAIAELKYTFLDGNWEGMRKLAFGMKSNPIISKVNNEEDFIKLVGHIYYNYNSEDSDFLSFYERNF